MAADALHRICARQSVRRIGWHTLRHTFASNLAAGGLPLPVVKELLGHSTITMTMRYAHLAPSSVLAAGVVIDRVFDSSTFEKNGQPAGNAALGPRQLLQVA